MPVVEARVRVPVPLELACTISEGRDWPESLAVRRVPPFQGRAS